MIASPFGRRHPTRHGRPSDRPATASDSRTPPESTETALTPYEAERAFIRVRPTADPLQPDGAVSHLRRLHQLTSPESGGRFQALLRRDPPSTVECLLLADGDGSVEYAFGVDDPTTTGRVERLLRGLFPNAYEVEAVDVDPLSQLPATPEATASVTYVGRPARRRDWQTQLTPLATFLTDDHARVPLAAVAETMASVPHPVAYQALLTPRPDWSRAVADRQASIEANQDTIGAQLTNVIFGPPEGDHDHLTNDDRTRLEELGAKDAHRSFDVTARAVVLGTADEIDDVEATARELATALSPIGRTSFDVEGVVSTGAKAAATYTHLRDRTASTRRRFIRRPTRIVADPAEVGSFCLVGGDALTAAGARAVAPTPRERTALPRPPIKQLERYHGSGLTLGHPLTQDGTPDPTPLVLPPSLQRLHVAWFGKTGSGKSTSVITAILNNHAATDGASILIDPKGDGMALDYCRAHFARFGTLDDVLYFNCAEILPAFAFFDISDELDAGVPRTTAVEDKVDHYVEILTQIMGRDRFEQAVRSPDVIRYLVKAGFDPINGDDAFGHRDLHSMVRRMHERQSAPSVSDPDLEQALGGVVANRARTFDEIMAGVANRVEKIPVDQRLARIFNHVPEEGDPHFDLADYLDEDVVIIFDTGDLREEAQRVLALVILSNLWTALRRRKRRDSKGTHGLVNVYVEEAASIAVSGLLKTLLAQSRGFDCSVILSMQFPAQLRGADPTAYDEVLNNVSTFVTGNVPVDSRLAERLATDDMDATAVGNRLRALRRGQWLVSLPAAFDEPEPRPFLVGSASPPPGDPAGDQPLTPEEEAVFETAIEGLFDRTLTEAGLTLSKPSPAEPVELDETDTEAERPTLRVDSALPHTRRLPPTVEYDVAIHGLRCRACDSRYDASPEGVLRGIECCSSLDEVDRDDIPICDLNLKLSPEERQASGWSDGDLMLLQAVHNATQGRFDPLEYDIKRDSMLRLQEYVGVDTEAVDALIEAGLLRHDTDHPHRLYSITPDGRKLIGEGYREGVDYGHGKGDLEESSVHVLGIELGGQLVETAFIANPDSTAVELVPYHDVDDQQRLDLAGLDADGNVVVAVEVERINHDYRRAVPEDYDKMAACNPEEAIWITPSRKAAHQVVAALADPPDGEPRVTKTYAKTTAPQDFRIDEPGMTAIYTFEYVRDTLLTE